MTDFSKRTKSFCIFMFYFFLPPPALFINWFPFCSSYPKSSFKFDARCRLQFRLHCNLAIVIVEEAETSFTMSGPDAGVVSKSKSVRRHFIEDSLPVFSSFFLFPHVLLKTNLILLRLYAISLIDIHSLCSSHDVTLLSHL